MYLIALNFWIVIEKNKWQYLLNLNFKVESIFKNENPSFLPREMAAK